MNMSDFKCKDQYHSGNNDDQSLNEFNREDISKINRRISLDIILKENTSYSENNDNIQFNNKVNSKLKDYKIKGNLFSPVKTFFSDFITEENNYNSNYNTTNNYYNNNTLNNYNITYNNNNYIINNTFSNNLEDLKSLENPAAVRYNGNVTTNTRYNSTSTREKGGLLFETIKERKTYEEKVNILQIRLKKLKDQEEDLNKKLKFEKKKVFKVDKIRDYVQENKKKYMLEKQLRQKEIERLKKVHLLEKEKQREKKNEKQENIKREKEKKFNLIKKDKMLLNSLVDSMKIQSSNVKCYNYFKNKQEEICSKVQRFNKYKEKEGVLNEKFHTKIFLEQNQTCNLKKELEKLEELEVEYMKKLENTIINNKKEFDHIEKTKGLNLSRNSLKIKQNVLQKSDSLVHLESPSEKLYKFEKLDFNTENSNKKNSSNTYIFTEYNIEYEKNSQRINDYKRIGINRKRSTLTKINEKNEIKEKNNHLDKTKFGFIKEKNIGKKTNNLSSAKKSNPLNENQKQIRLKDLSKSDKIKGKSTFYIGPFKENKVKNFENNFHFNKCSSGLKKNNSLSVFPGNWNKVTSNFMDENVTANNNENKITEMNHLKTSKKMKYETAIKYSGKKISSAITDKNINTDIKEVKINENLGKIKNKTIETGTTKNNYSSNSVFTSKNLKNETVKKIEFYEKNTNKEKKSLKKK